MHARDTRDALARASKRANGVPIDYFLLSLLNRIMSSLSSNVSGRLIIPALPSSNSSRGSRGGMPGIDSRDEHRALSPIRPHYCHEDWRKTNSETKGTIVINDGLASPPSSNPSFSQALDIRPHDTPLRPVEPPPQGPNTTPARPRKRRRSETVMLSPSESSAASDPDDSDFELNPLSTRFPRKPLRLKRMRTTASRPVKPATGWVVPDSCESASDMEFTPERDCLEKDESSKIDLRGAMEDALDQAAQCWPFMDPKHRARYVKNKALRDRIWPLHERASLSKLNDEYHDMRVSGEDLSIAHAYAFDGHGDPYAEYKPGVGVPACLRGLYIKGRSGEGRMLVEGDNAASDTLIKPSNVRYHHLPRPCVIVPYRSKKELAQFQTMDGFEKPETR